MDISRLNQGMNSSSSGQVVGPWPAASSRGFSSGWTLPSCDIWAVPTWSVCDCAVAREDAASSSCLIMTSFSLWVPLVGFCFICYRSSQSAMSIHHLLGKMMALRKGSHMASFLFRTKRRGWPGLWMVVTAFQLGTEVSRAWLSPIREEMISSWEERSLGKSSLYKLEDLSLNPQNPHKDPGIVVCSNNSKTQFKHRQIFATEWLY